MTRISILLLSIFLGGSVGASASPYYVDASINADLSGFRINIVERKRQSIRFCEFDIENWEVYPGTTNGSLNINVSISEDRCIAGSGHHFGWKWFSFEDVPYGQYSLTVNGTPVGLLKADREMVRVLR